MSTNAIITRLKARLEESKLNIAAQATTSPRDKFDIVCLTHDSATDALIPLLKQAIQGLEKISMYHSHEGNLAREFLASIRDGSER